MAVKSQHVTVGTTAVRLSVESETDVARSPLLAARTFGSSLIMLNKGEVSVFTGGPDVTPTTGFEVAPGSVKAMDLYGSDSSWGVTASGTAVCHIEQSGI